MDLTNKQKAFVEEYLQDFNATRAAERAGYSGDDSSLAAQGSRLLRNVKVAKKISERLQAAAMSADEVLDRLAEQARGEYASYIQDDGMVDLSQLVADGKAHLIKAIRPNKYGYSIEFYDAQSALALIGKHHRLFVERQERSGPEGGPIEIRHKVDLSGWTVDDLERLDTLMARITDGNQSGN